MEVCLLGIKLWEICGLVGDRWGLWVKGCNGRRKRRR